MSASDHQLAVQQRREARAARNAEMVAMRDEGATLEEIGDQFGITRERARQILAKANATGADELRARRSQERESEDRALTESIRQDVRENPGATRTEIAGRLGVHRRSVVRLLPADVAALVVEDKTGAPTSKWSDDAIVAAVRQAATYEYPLSGVAYQRLVTLGEVTGPSRALVHKRLGSWTRACELAGVEPDRAAHAGYQSRWTDADLLGYVATYLRKAGSAGTYAGYIAWARDQTGAPSGPSIRNRLGGWGEIKRAALQGGKAHYEGETSP